MHDDHNHPKDDSLNFPFHHHYERQKLGLERSDSSIIVPPYILCAFDEEQSLSDFSDPACPFVYLPVTLDLDENPVLKNDKTSLEQTLEFLIDNKIGAMLSLSPEENEERLTTGTILDTISRIWDEECSPLIVASPLPVCLSTAQEIMPSLPRALMIEKWLKETNFASLPELVESLQPSLLILEDQNLTESMMESLLDTELPLAIIMTGDDQLHAKRLQSWGTDSLISPMALKLQENLGQP